MSDAGGPEHLRAQAWVTGLLIMATIAAYFAGPILPYVDAGILVLGGLALGAGAGLFWIYVHNNSPRWAFVQLALGVVGTIIITWCVTSAQNTLGANQVRCAHIQREMLLPTPRRTDLPELFQALDCKVQGEDDVQFPPPLPVAPTLLVPTPTASSTKLRTISPVTRATTR